MTTTPSSAPSACVKALYKSRNLVSIRVLQAIGIDYARDYVARFGFNKEDLPRNLSLALGTANPGPKPVVATGWSTFANGGKLNNIEQRWIDASTLISSTSRIALAPNFFKTYKK